MMQTEDHRVTRWEDIDRAKGLAIILVVAGHAVARDMPSEAEWFYAVKSGIYGFHMAFFMFLSGFLFFISNQPQRALKNYSSFALGRISRFLPAYAVFALLVWSAKAIAQRFTHVDNAGGSLSDLILIFLTPTTSVVSFLWYIWVLMVFHLAVPWLLHMRKSVLFWTLLSLPLVFITAPYLFGLDKIFKYLFFFFVGGLIAENSSRYLELLEKTWLIFLICFAAALIVLDPKEFSLLLGVLSIPALHGLVRWGPLSSWRWLAFIGSMSYAIYLMNTMAIGGVKAVVFAFTTWDGDNFFWVLPLLVLSGVLMPVLVKRAVFSRSKWLDRITA